MAVSKTVKNAAQLQSALKSAKGGDTIYLASGDYGDFRFANLNFSSDVTIKSLDTKNPAVFDSVMVSKVANLKLDGIEIDFVPNATTVAHASALRISSSKNITLTNSTLEGGPSVNGVPITTPRGQLDATGNVLGLPAGRGITIDKSTGVTIENSEISTFHKGIALSDVDGLVIRNNEVHHLRTSPITGGDVSNAVIDGNHFHTSFPWNFGGEGDHGDLIHLWTVKGSQSGASTNISITNNVLDQGKGEALLGVYLDDNKNGLGFKDVVISDNTIFNSNSQGIRLENVVGSVRDNTLLQATADSYKTAPGVLIVDGSQIDLRNNLLGSVKIYDGGTAVETGNVVVQRQDASGAGYYGDLFGGALSSVPGLADLQGLSRTIAAAFRAGATTTPAAGKFDAAAQATDTSPILSPISSPQPVVPAAVAPVTPEPVIVPAAASTITAPAAAAPATPIVVPAAPVVAPTVPAAVAPVPVFSGVDWFGLGTLAQVVPAAPVASSATNPFLSSSTVVTVNKKTSIATILSTTRFLTRRMDILHA